MEFIVSELESGCWRVEYQQAKFINNSKWIFFIIMSVGYVWNRDMLHDSRKNNKQFTCYDDDQACNVVYN